MNQRLTPEESSKMYWKARLESGRTKKHVAFGEKGDTRRLFQLLVCIHDLETPTLMTISLATGQNKGSIDANIERLKQFGVIIKKEGAVYKVEHLGNLLEIDALRNFVMDLDPSQNF